MTSSNELEKKAIDNLSTLFDDHQLPVSVNDVKLWLEQKVKYLLDHDFNALVNILYRIDVYESKAKQCFGQENSQIAKCLANLIWERQMQKFQNLK